MDTGHSDLCCGLGVCVCVCVRLCNFILPPHKSLGWIPDSHPTYKYYWWPLGVTRDCNPETGSGINIHLPDPVTAYFRKIIALLKEIAFLCVRVLWHIDKKLKLFTYFAVLCTVLSMWTYEKNRISYCHYINILADIGIYMLWNWLKKFDRIRPD